MAKEKEAAKQAAEALRQTLTKHGERGGLVALDALERYQGGLRDAVRVETDTRTAMAQTNTALRNKVAELEKKLQEQQTENHQLKQIQQGLRFELANTAAALEKAKPPVVTGGVVQWCPDRKRDITYPGERILTALVAQERLDHLVRDSDLPMVTSEILASRIDQLRHVVSRHFAETPARKSLYRQILKGDCTGVYMPQSMYAPLFGADEYTLMGMCIKFAGLYGTKVCVEGQSQVPGRRERAYLEERHRQAGNDPATAQKDFMESFNAAPLRKANRPATP